MFFNKYKIQRNNGLLPKIEPNKPESAITSYCLLNKEKERQYNIQINPSNNKMVIMFNDKEYLHRKCSYISSSNNAPDILQQIDSIYPHQQHTLAIFVVNQPHYADQIILGVNSPQSLLSKAYQQLHSTKQRESKIKLSVIGIQNQNSLTDQLNFQWLQFNNLQQQQVPLKSIIKSKQKLKVLRNKQNNGFFTQNVTKHTIQSQQKLSQLLIRYKDVKTHFSKWILNTQFTQYYLLGQLYHLQEIQQPTQDHPQITINSHYILAVNQYIRTTSPLMLRIGMNLRRVQQQNLKMVEMHQSKLFKLLSECFTSKYANNTKNYHYHLFLQVGEYFNLKDQYVSLVPVSQFLTKNQLSRHVLDSPFFYTKQFMEYPQVHKMMSTLLNIKSILKQKTILPQISQMVKERLKTKSYVCQTYSSQQKKIDKFHRMLTQSSHQHLDLQELVNETAKIYKLPTPKKSPKQVSRDSSFHKARLVPKYIPTKLFHEEISFNQQKQTVFQNRKKQLNLQSKKQLPRNQFYQHTKQWLGAIYGKSSIKKLKGAKAMNKVEQTTNSLIKEMLRQQMKNERQEVENAIDRFN